MDKAQIRKKSLETRLKISETELKSRSEIIEKRLLTSEWWPKVGRVGLYASVKNEVLTYDLFRQALEQGLHVYFPRVEQGIKFYEVNGPEDLQKGSWGIPEPNLNCEEINLEENQLDILVIPGIAFSEDCYRVGYGKGFYDAAIKTMTTTTIGLAFDSQIHSTLPTDDWDERLDVVISESKTYSVKEI